MITLLLILSAAFGLGMVILYADDPDAQTVDRIRERVMDEIHARRLQRDPIRWLS